MEAGRSLPPRGRGLPAPLAERLAAGCWIRTAHRGAPKVAPGNTLRALEAAAAMGVDLVEVDVRRTPDGVLALWHDAAVGSGGRLPIARTPYPELRSAVREALGEELVDLPAAAATVKGRAGLMVDLKEPGLVPDIVAALRAGEFEDAVVCGDFWRDLREVKQLAPALGTSLTLGVGWREGVAGPRVEEIDTDAVTVAWRHVNRDFLGRCHTRGLAVLVWTVDRPFRMRRLLRLGVDGLTSNRPDLLMSLEARR
ncbi:MAG TPA: glycerophosphodiester phosphodiesterase [Trueperaceae bacterium]|nr:glycerophosphodiester phosphodiesterase [Trueperaceae bacterium]